MTQRAGGFPVFDNFLSGRPASIILDKLLDRNWDSKGKTLRKRNAGKSH
jgi:hypothetical protein